MTTRRLLLLLLLGQTLDAVSFAYVVGKYPWVLAFELNPFAILAAVVGGVLVVPILKVGISGFLTYLMGWSRWRPPTMPRWLTLLLIVATVSGFIGFAANTYSLIEIRTLGL